MDDPPGVYRTNVRRRGLPPQISKNKKEKIMTVKELREMLGKCDEGASEREICVMIGDKGYPVERMGCYILDAEGYPYNFLEISETSIEDRYGIEVG